MGFLSEPLEGESSVRIVSREEWGGREPKVVESPPRKLDCPLTHVTFTHTKTESCYSVEECGRIIKEMQDRQMDYAELPDITYNFLIGGDGLVYEARGWSVEPLRPYLYDYVGTRGVEISYIGDYEDESPPENMLKTAFNFMLFGIRSNLISPSFQTIHLA